MKQVLKDYENFVNSQDIKQDADLKSTEITVLPEKKEEKDYLRLIAAQNESARRLKIKSVVNEISDEYKSKVKYAIISGVCFTGVAVATYFSGVDAEQALKTEIEALNSFDALKDYLATFTPAMWGTLIAFASCEAKFIMHNKKYKKATREFYDMLDNQPVDYQDVVKSQAKSR